MPCAAARSKRSETEGTKLLIHRKRSPFPHKGRLGVTEPAGETLQSEL